MKTRCGLVSNSSSSSFVFLGFKLRDGKGSGTSQRERLLKILDLPPETNLETCEDILSRGFKVNGFSIVCHDHGDELGLPRGEYLLGIEPLYIGEDGWRSRELDLLSLQKTLDTLGEKAGLSQEETTILLYAGTRYC